jgi:hypothetical protein
VSELVVAAGSSASFGQAVVASDGVNRLQLLVGKEGSENTANLAGRKFTL